jgi:hypothetical protein
MSVKAICEICGDTDDWCQDNAPFFPAGARGEIIDDNGGERAIMKFDICQTCVEKHLLPLFKEVPDDVAKNYPDFEPAPTKA